MTRHLPVLLREVLEALAPQDHAIYVDGTFGAGGYSAGILASANCTVWGIDCDPTALKSGDDLAKESNGHLKLVAGKFGDMDALLRAQGVDAVDGVTLDIGVSSMQLDTPSRGFSFRADGPLDMRMSLQGPTAADIVNEYDEVTLADIIHVYGEEHRARHVARAIVAARKESLIETTGRLADIVRSVVRKSSPGIDPATKTFQALRIYVNDELGELRRGLCAAENLLRPGGRLAVVSFHSLEDRLVKSFLNARSGAEPRGSRHRPASIKDTPTPSFLHVSRRATPPDDDEIRANPRARSARLRAAIRTSAPPWPQEVAA